MKKKISHKQLCIEGARWLNKKASNIYYRSQFVCVELSCQGTREIPDVLGLRPYGPVMIEVKTSRSDFLKDFTKPQRMDGSKPLGTYNFYLAPEGIIKAEEVPENWGLLEWDGKRVKEVSDPQKVENDTEALIYVYHSVLRRESKAGILDYRMPANNV